MASFDKITKSISLGLLNIERKTGKIASGGIKTNMRFHLIKESPYRIQFKSRKYIIYIYAEGK